MSNNFPNNNVVKFTAPGVSSVFADTGLNGANGLAMDASGNLFVSNYNDNTIRKFTPGGVGSPFASVGAASSHFLQALAFDNAGNLYAADARANTVLKFTPGGVSSVFADSSDGLANPTDLVFDSAGNLLVSLGGNGGGNSILKFAPDGTGSLFANTGMSYTFGLAFDTAGFLHVGDINGNVIKKYSPDGLSSSVFANSGLNNPAGLEFDDAGNLLVANYGNSTIETFTPGGVGSPFASTNLSGPNFILFIPEPSTCLLLGLGIPALLAFRRRKA